MIMTHKVSEQKLTTSQRIAQHKPIEVWESADGAWRWEVYKLNTKFTDKPYASAFCKVFSPFVPEGELGDVYWTDIKQNAHQIFKEKNE